MYVLHEAVYTIGSSKESSENSHKLEKLII